MKQPPIIKYLLLYNLFISFALTITSNFTFIDRLLLRMDIDLALFGTIKSFMFLMPALLYQFISPLFENKIKYTSLCIYSYLLRNIFPCILPFVVLLTSNAVILTICSSIFLSLGMTAATFANNYLIKIYRISVPDDKFNYHVCSFYMMMSVPALLLAFPLAMVLDRFENFSDQTFFIAFGSLQILTTLFELPAIYCMRKIKLPQLSQVNKNIRSAAASLKNMIAPYRIPKFRTLLTIVSLHRLGAGLLSTYLTVYFLEVMKMRISVVVFISAAVGLTACLLLPSGAKLMDKAGYGRTFIFLAGGMLCGLLLFCSAWQTIWVLPFFAILLWNANDAIVPALLAQGEFASSTRLTPPDMLNSAVSAYTIVYNCANAAGMLAASLLYKLAQSVSGRYLGTTLHSYHLMCIPIFVVLFSVSIYFQRLPDKIEQPAHQPNT